MYCNKCGSEIKQGYKFCVKCGNKIENNTNEIHTNKNINEVIQEFIVELIDICKKLIKKFKKLQKPYQLAIITVSIIVIVLLIVPKTLDNKKSSSSKSSSNKNYSYSSSNDTSYETGIDIIKWGTVTTGMTYNQVISKLGYPLSTANYSNGYGYNMYPCTVLTYKVTRYGESKYLTIVIEKSHNIVTDKDNW